MLYICTGVCIYVCSHNLILFDIPLAVVLVMLVDIDKTNFLCKCESITQLHPISFTISPLNNRHII